MIDRLERLLDRKHLTKKDFCDIIGVDSSYFSNWKKRGFPAARLPQAARALGMTLDELTHGTDMAPPTGSSVHDECQISDETSGNYLISEGIDDRALHLAVMLSSALRTGQIEITDIRLLEQIAQRMFKTRQ